MTGKKISLFNFLTFTMTCCGAAFGLLGSLPASATEPVRESLRGVVRATLDRTALDNSSGPDSSSGPNNSSGLIHLNVLTSVSQSPAGISTTAARKKPALYSKTSAKAASTKKAPAVRRAKYRNVGKRSAVINAASTSPKRGAGKATRAGLIAISQRGKSLSAKSLGGTRSSARLKKVALDDALETPTETHFIRHHPTEPLSVVLGSSGIPVANNLSSLINGIDSASRVRDAAGNNISLTLDPLLQQSAEGLLLRYSVPWGSIVAMDPHTGAIKAIASYSSHEPDGPEVATRGGFPAASLFKIVTSAAAIERAGMVGENLVNFRGGNYTLSKANYVPDASSDRRHMSLAEALGRSCNPVFARVALQNFSPSMLQRYAEKFGFNQEAAFDAPLAGSTFSLAPDHYAFARTAAGFGEVTVTPVHAAAMVASLSNSGVMMRPYLISRMTDPQGKLLYLAKNVAVRSVVRPETARELLLMMQNTVEIGTARRHFVNSSLSNVPIAAKTGTLSGTSPKGTYHWFVAAIPANNPELVISVLLIDPGYSRANAVNIGRQFLERGYHIKEPRIEAVRDPEVEVEGEPAPVKGTDSLS